MCDRNPRDKGEWCAKHQAKMVADQLKSEAWPRSYNSRHHSNLIVECQVFYDWSMAAVTVIFLWVPRAWWKKPGNWETRGRLIRRVHWFSLTNKTRVRSNVMNNWWVTIRRWVTVEADAQGYGFARSCKWVQVNGPGTERFALVGGTPEGEPFFGHLDLRFLCSKPVHPYWREPTTDFTPVKFKDNIVCETCGKTMGDAAHRPECPGLVVFQQAKEKWHTWYVQHMGTEPVLNPNEVPSFPNRGWGDGILLNH